MFTDFRTPQGQSVIMILYHCGFPQHRIASLFDCNQGRISEVVGERKNPLPASTD